MPKPKAELPMFALVAAFVFLQLPEACIARTRNKDCGSSMCGNVNISYPFRLTTQPPNCGDPRFQLNCDGNNNNRTILVMRHGRFYVQNISYQHRTIQAIDGNLGSGDNCSLPRSSLLFWDRRSGEIPYYWASPLGLIYLVNCTTPMKSSIYINASRCPISSSDPPPASSYYVYFLDGNISPREFDESCTIEALVLVMVENISGYSTSDIYEKLLNRGFEIPWIIDFSSRQQDRPFQAM